MSSLLVPFICFIAVFFFIVSIAAFIGLIRNPIDRRITEVRQERKPTKVPNLLLKERDINLMASIGQRIAPKDAEKKMDTKKRLAQAGYYTEFAYYSYWGIKIALITILPVLVLLYFLVNLKPLNTATLPILISMGMAFFLPDFYLSMKKKRRHEQIFRGLPDMLDLMVVCIEAGLGLDAAMVKVSEEFSLSNKVLSMELQMTCASIRLGQQRRDALYELGERTGVQDLKSFCSVLIQAERFGTSMGQALRIHAEDMRVRRRQRAEELAAKTTVKLIVPLVIFIFPSIFVVVGGPALIKIYEMLVKK